MSRGLGDVYKRQELSRGRGGPRCMSCPIVREDID
nr:arginine deiminase family protein [Lactobacillus jensenii]